MNKKFVKENKKQLKEFLGTLLTKAVGATLTRGFDKEKEFEKFPELKKSQDDLRKLGRQLDKRLEKIKRTRPEVYARLKAQGRTNFLR